MSENNCYGGGRCRPPIPDELTRREFLGVFALGAGSLAAGTMLPAITARTPERVPAFPDSWRHPITPPRVYGGKFLEAVAMPIGGIGTGSVWLDGQGRLGVWQIFNNLNETRVPDSFFAIRARTGNAAPVVRVLQTVPEGNLQPVESLTYEGGYPIARLAFSDKALPVEVRLEAFNPLIPTDAANSSIPCAIFRLTVRNRGQTAADVEFIATCQNAIGSRGEPGISGRRSRGYGRNRNRAVRSNGWAALSMEKAFEPVETGPVKIRAGSGEIVPAPEMFWFASLSSLSMASAEILMRIAKAGGVVVAADVQPSFMSDIAALRGGAEELKTKYTVFEDFERGNYDGWTITGEGFGKQPSTGTHPNQQRVSGFLGRGLVNTYLPNDEPQGTMQSRPFRIERRYIGFLVGGGAHRNETCINLRVAGKVVRSTTGKNREQLEPASWDVSEFRGQEAIIEIVDKRSDGWGHINVDQIVFSDIPPEAVLQIGTPVGEAARAIAIPFSAAVVSQKQEAGFAVKMLPEAPAALRNIREQWRVTQYTKLEGFQNGAGGHRVWAATADGDPLIIEGPLGQGRIVIALAKDLPWSWAAALFASARTTPLKDGERIVPAIPGWGTMALAALDERAIVTPRWDSHEEIAAGLKDGEDSGESQPGETYDGAITVPIALAPGQERTATFVLTWHFPNVTRFKHEGNYYSRRWPDAMAVVREVAANAEPLWQRTRLYHETLYQSNIPEEFLDAISSQVVILRGPTCWWSEDGYFAGFEGSYGCCPLNCTHVWNYAQSHARLFPEVGRNMRISDLVTYLHSSGETSHRQHEPHGAFIDGHCATISAALREHQLSADNSFLEKIWPGLKKATDWMIEKFDADHDGVPSGKQWNTYDTAVSGANTFIGSQYLAALAAAERLAMVMGDNESAARWRAVREAGMKNQNERLWNGEYYIQIPGTPPDRDYNNGCLSDQLLGQWWAHLLALGYLYPQERVRRAMQSVCRYNFREKFAGFKQDPRRYIPDDEGGLLICTWPHNDRPKPFILYADEVWTGIEYAAAGLMVYEGLLDEARRIVKMARSRYDGRKRDGLNSGPGGNPFNELECGKFYARAMSSWSLLLASQGFILDGPAGILGFKPRWQPEDHRSFFTAPEGWGLFIQKRENQIQLERIELRHGRLRIKELVFESNGTTRVTVRLENRAIQAAPQRNGNEVRLLLQQPLTVSEGQTLEIELRA